MTYSLRLITSRLTIVGINEVNNAMLEDYFLNNHQHLKKGGGFVPRTPRDVGGVLKNWQQQINNETEVRFFMLVKNQLIGAIGVSNIVRGAFQAGYLGYNIAQKYQGQGYMTEALEEVVAFAFSALNLHRLMANYRPDNLASGRVLQKLGFEKEGYAEKYLMVDGIWEDHILTSLRNDHWMQY